MGRRSGRRVRRRGGSLGAGEGAPAGGHGPADMARGGLPMSGSGAAPMYVDALGEGTPSGDITPPRSAFTTPRDLRGQVCAALACGPPRGSHAGCVDHVSDGTEELDTRSDPGDPPGGEVDAAGDTTMSRGPDHGGEPVEEWFCPITGCGHSRGDGRRGYATRQSVLQHVLAVHVSGGHEIPAAWFVAVGVRLCTHCNIFVTRGEACVGPRCTHTLLRSWEGRYDRAEVDEGAYAAPLDGAAPVGGEAALERVLGGSFRLHDGWRAGARTRSEEH